MTDLPDNELDAFLMTVTEALDLARDGQTLDGYRCLLGGRERAQEAADDGEPWGPDLVQRYSETLLRYGEEWALTVE